MVTILQASQPKKSGDNTRDFGVQKAPEKRDVGVQVGKLRGTVHYEPVGACALTMRTGKALGDFWAEYRAVDTETSDQRWVFLKQKLEQRGLPVPEEDAIEKRNEIK